MDVFKWEPKQKKCPRTLKHFLFLSLESEKKNQNPKSQTGTHPAQGKGFITQAFFTDFFKKTCTPCSFILLKVEMLFPDLYWYTQMLKK